MAPAQEGRGVRKIAALSPFAEGNAEGKATLDVFRNRLRELGWSEDRNIRLDIRWDGGDVERTKIFAAELVRLSPDVIFAYFNAQLAALSHETATIPIVFVGASDPVGAGYVASIPRPGRNITGFTLYEPSLAGKWLDLLKEMVPGLARVALMVNPETAVLHGTFYSRAFADAASALSIDPITATVHTPADIETAITSLGLQPGSGLILGPDTFTETYGELIVSLAAKHRVPAVYGVDHFARKGALVSYGPDILDAVRRAVAYVDRILRGERPAEMPVQAPTKFETIVNLQTAKALGLTMPPGILAAADEVIE
ncbi:MAG: ABC transporter substrate-binding protein [Xanthobacteraceae bacterium]